MFVDTHCHLNMMVEKERNEALHKAHLPHIDAFVAKAQAAGVTTLINVGTTVGETYNSCTIARRHERVFATAGIHPCDVTATWQQDFRDLKAMIDERRRNKIIALGETGLDFYHQPFDAQLQEAAFRAHIELAITLDMPLVVHVREAGDEALKIVEEYRHEARGVIHCFSLELMVAREVTSWGWLIGIDGPVTYKKNDYLREIVANVPLTSLLLETDAPFLTPQAFRGKPNKPAYLPFVAQEIAIQRGITVEEVGRVTTQNVKKLFGV
ncbi:MAG: TatD family hydrolase [Candidatus Dependentiae bacterium]|jgi:TatD DNase family protein